jgi:hypothetical protein
MDAEPDHYLSTLPSPALVLYGTTDCHLCEQAQQILLSALGMSVSEVDIADSAGLLARYAVRVPVLRRLDTGAELDWPFGPDAVRRFAG